MRASATDPRPNTRAHSLEILLPAAPEEVFSLLITPSAIRGWWGASRVIVMAEPDGTWAAAWGENENDPDYITVATMSVFDPPRRVVFSDYRYRSKSGPLPFQADFTTEFVVEQRDGGSLLRVTQDGFPCDAVADEFYAACEKGWHDTFENIRRFIGGRP